MSIALSWLLIGILIVIYDCMSDHELRAIYAQYKGMIVFQIIRWPISLFRRWQNRKSTNEKLSDLVGFKNNDYLTTVDGLQTRTPTSNPAQYRKVKKFLSALWFVFQSLIPKKKLCLPGTIPLRSRRGGPAVLFWGLKLYVGMV